MSKEIELKLVFPEHELTAIKAHPLLANATPKGIAETLESTYFDTADLALQAAGIVVRTRQTSAGLLQTVKCAAPSMAGLSARPEWEQACDGRMDFSNIEEKQVRKLLESKAKKLRPVFSTQFHRQTFLAQPQAGSSLLIMIDIGNVISGNCKSPICEMELELVSGTGLDLLDFAIKLAGALPLIPFDQSKAERGYRLFSKTDEKPLKSGKTPVTRDMTTATAFQALAVQAQQCWQANLHGALGSDNPEFVHQFRVALRRLDTLLKIFKPALPAEFLNEWPATLKNLARLTGETRDLEVMRETILDPALKAANSIADRHAMQLAVDACIQARTLAESRLDLHQNSLPLLGFARAIHSTNLDNAQPDIVIFAEKQLSRLHRKAVQRFTQVVKVPTAENAHRLRITLKHLRYGCEFFARLFATTAMLDYARQIANLQDELGYINDLHVALGRLDRWSSTDDRFRVTRQYLVTSQAARIDRKLEKALTASQSLLGHCQPWCGECERRRLGSLGKRIRQGVAVEFE